MNPPETPGTHGWTIETIDTRTRHNANMLVYHYSSNGLTVDPVRLPKWWTIPATYGITEFEFYYANTDATHEWKDGVTI